MDCSAVRASLSLRYLTNQSGTSDVHVPNERAVDIFHPSVPLLPLCDASNRRCLDLNGVNTYLLGRVIRQARYSGDNGAQHFVLEIEIWLSAKRSSFEAAKDLGSFRSETLDPRPMPASQLPQRHSLQAYNLPPSYIQGLRCAAPE